MRRAGRMVCVLFLFFPFLRWCLVTKIRMARFLATVGEGCTLGTTDVGTTLVYPPG